jgi:pimeloyl-ACP methyl ester carboxylesterase
MAKTKQKKAKRKSRSASGKSGSIDGFKLNAVEDARDFRDYSYRPALIPLKEKVDPPADPLILDQGQEGACTGFGLGAVINLLLNRRKGAKQVSTRMLYEMAKRYDEWDGTDYSGSSCRGAIKGWYNMGVCSEELAPYKSEEEHWSLTIKQAEDARKTTPGAYYRIKRLLSDFHAALNEVEAIYVSARVHEGWRRSNVKKGKIPFRPGTIGGHAFAVVGYNSEGFWVQNSWGENWGKGGLALWSYEDWLENVQDAWVVRLALSTPQVWHLSPSGSAGPDRELGLFKRSPKRAEILGHFVHIDDGNFDSKGVYWADAATVRQTAELVAASDKYDHLLLYAHGGLNSIKDSARRIVAMKEVFKANRIYPFHFMYDTGLLEEIKDIILGKKGEVDRRTAGFTDYTDKLIEKLTRQVGRAIWREMKRGAKKPFEPGFAGSQTIEAFLEAFAGKNAKPKKVHLVGHSTGAILLAHLLQALSRTGNAPRIETCTLLAPACTHGDFKSFYRPLLRERNKNSFGINRMAVFMLDGQLELKDTVTPLYRKSLLYLVSNAFEEKAGESILGMEVFYKYLRKLPGRPVFRVETSHGLEDISAKTASETHGGFDNDIRTMNTLLKMILKKKPEKPFAKRDLEY